MTKAKPPHQVTADLVRLALASIPPDIGHDDRVRIAFAVFDGIGDAGADLWLDWAGGRSEPGAAEDRAVWKSARNPGTVTVATLFGIAKGYGFKFSVEGARAAPALSAAEQQRMAEERRRKHNAEEEAMQARREVSAQRAQLLWDGAKVDQPKAGIPYLKRKGVQAYGLRFLPGGTALVPMRDATGRVWNVQRLLPKPLRDRDTGKEGTDKLYGPPKADPTEEVSSRKLGLWHWIGEPAGAAVLLLAEGYATASTLHEATGRPVAVCFDAGNLVHVAREVRALFPAPLLLMCGDDDRGTEARRGKNPGRLAAAAAALAAHCETGPAAAVFPAGLADGHKDFNDLHASAGLEAVRVQIEAAILAPAAPEAPTPRQRAKSGAGGAIGGGGQGLPPVEPQPGPGGPTDENSEPDEKGFFLNERGVWHVGRGRDGSPLRPNLLCGPLWVSAITANEAGNGFGYLIEFTGRKGARRHWSAPVALFNGDSGDWAARLRDMGLRMEYGTAVRNLVGKYIDSREPAAFVTCVDKVGWQGNVYVLPERCIGASEGRRFVFQNEGLVDEIFKQRGSLTEWQSSVGARCVGNSRLVFAVCCALAGPTMSITGLATGLFHYLGASSLGKSTALLVAASVWGPPSFKQQWRATDNGLEGLAVAFNDSCLILDESSQMDARTIGEAIYMLTNEAMKVRATSRILLGNRKTWRLNILSSGEKSPAEHMLEAGKKPNEGQLVRMPSVPADAGKGFGMFEDIHEARTPKAFAETLEREAATVYGTAGLAWLQWLCVNRDALTADWPEARAALVEKMGPPGAHPQVQRVATRFAQVGLAGERATRAGVTGWQLCEAEAAATACFKAWLASRGHSGSGEHAAMLRQVRSAIEAHGEARFTWTDRALDNHSPRTMARLGFKRYVDEHGTPLKFDAATEYADKRSPEEMRQMYGALVEYWVLPEQFQNEICKGFPHHAVANLLKARGHLKHEPDRLTIKHRMPGLGMAACFHILPSLFDDSL